MDWPIDGTLEEIQIFNRVRKAKNRKKNRHISTGMSTVVCICGAFACVCVSECARAFFSVCVCLCVCVLFVTPRRRSTAISLILCVCACVVVYLCPFCCCSSSRHVTAILISLTLLCMFMCMTVWLCPFCRCSSSAAGGRFSVILATCLCMYARMRV